MTAPPSERRIRQCDAVLTAAVADLLAYDRRLTGLRVEVSFDGGVAHLTGEVADPATLALLRSLIGRLDGVLAVWDRVRVAGRDPVILDLGCGETLQYPGNLGIDRRPAKTVSVVADLTAGLPVAGGTADAMFAVHVLEHLHDYLPLLDDIHRALRPGGILHVLAPWWRHVNAVADPTHVRLFDRQTIKGICVRPPPAAGWTPLHVACDGATVFADLRACLPGEAPDPAALDRFFD